jgi:quinone-modifying oxidoreductase subunit QmoA
VIKVAGQPGDYTVTVQMNPRFINENCTACGDCVAVCPVERSNSFNFGLNKTKAVYKTTEMAFPARFTIDAAACKGTACGKCLAACKYSAIELDMKPKTLDLKVGAIIWATGWVPYDATKIDNLGYGTCQNVITNMVLERLASHNGPTQGRITRPSDGKEPASVAFVQCAGSRDEKHLPYCSYICCLASLKHATYIRERYPEAKIYIFYIDLRTPGYKYEKFYQKIKEDKNIFLIKGKVAEVKNTAGGQVTVVAENAVTGEKTQQTVDLVVLATGMQPTAAVTKLPADLKLNSDGFIVNDFAKGGMFAAGCANKPADVVSSNQNATGMALKAIQTLKR